MSSSRSAQWIPSPRPISRQLDHSVGVPCARRGYQARGTDTVRPSTRSTVNVSSDTATCRACACRVSAAKECLPKTQNRIQILFNYTLESADFQPVKTAAFLQSDRAQPKLGNIVITLDVNMGRFGSISRIEEETVRAASENRWHCRGILNHGLRLCQVYQQRARQAFGGFKANIASIVPGVSWATVRYSGSM